MPILAPSRSGIDRSRRGGSPSSARAPGVAATDAPVGVGPEQPLERGRRAPETAFSGVDQPVFAVRGSLGYRPESRTGSDGRHDLRVGLSLRSATTVAREGESGQAGRLTARSRRMSGPFHSRYSSSSSGSGRSCSGRRRNLGVVANSAMRSLSSSDMRSGMGSRWVGAPNVISRLSNLERTVNGVYAGRQCSPPSLRPP